jgi:hypothetical protein
MCIRDYMQRYCDLFRSRLTLELSGCFGISRSQSELIDLGDECLIEAIRFFQTLDSLKNHKFLPRTIFSGFRENIVGADQLTKGFLKVLADRNDSWYSELYELQPRQRGNKLSDYHRIVDFQIQKIHDTFYVSDLYDVKSKQILLLSAVDTLAMNIARHVATTSFADYGEEALLGHILACQENVRYFSHLRVYPHAGCKITTGSNLDSVSMDESKDKWVMALSRVCIEQVGGSFLRSAHEAATAAVLNISQTTMDIVDLLFVESGGWIGGKVVHAYLDRVTSWMESFCQRGASKPCEFHRIIRRETIRLVVVTYIRKLIDKYRLNKRFKLSSNGEEQVASDLQIIGRWVEQNNEKLIPSYVTDRGSYTGSNDVTMLIRNTRLFMTSDESNILLCFVESIQHFGLACAPHLYDLARLALKIRSDLSKKARLSTLGSFSCYITKLTAATIEGFGPLSHPHPRISGPSILQELFPNTGVTHCTGKKWSYEKLSDPDGHLNLEISTLVTDACSVARIRRAAYRDSSTTLHSASAATQASSPGNAQTASSSMLSQASSEAGESSDTWQLLDPDHLRMEHGPLDAERPSLQAIREERDRMMMAAAAISLLDAAEFSNDPSRDYEADSLKPFVDLHGCTFDELHLSLRPPMYDDTTFLPTMLRVPARAFSTVVAAIDTAGIVSDDDSVSEDEFFGFDGDYFGASERSLPLSPGSRNQGGREETNECKAAPASIIADPVDVEVEVEVGVSQMKLPAEGGEEEEVGGAVSTEAAPVQPEPVVRAVPPAKPPKPRRYSNCEPYDGSDSPDGGGSRAISSDTLYSESQEMQGPNLAAELTQAFQQHDDEGHTGG